jgi:hypothetical protein
MDREDDINRKNLLDQDLTGLAGLCANIAHNPSADYKQSDMARALRVEWVRLGLDRSLNSDKTEAEKSLKKRMGEFLAGVPSWMLGGL